MWEIAASFSLVNAFSANVVAGKERVWMSFSRGQGKSCQARAITMWGRSSSLQRTDLYLRGTAFRVSVHVGVHFALTNRILGRLSRSI
jgi:hypothetical protein